MAIEKNDRVVPFIETGHHAPHLVGASALGEESCCNDDRNDCSHHSSLLNQLTTTVLAILTTSISTVCAEGVVRCNPALPRSSGEIDGAPSETEVAHCQIRPRQKAGSAASSHHCDDNVP